MEVNISDYATGEVLSMTVRIGDRDQQQYLLKSLNKTERNCEIYDIEMIRELEN